MLEDMELTELSLDTLKVLHEVVSELAKKSNDKKYKIFWKI